MRLKLFGHQLKFVQDVIKAHRQPLDAGLDQTEAQSRAQLAQQYSRILMQIVTSIAILGFCFWMLIHTNNDQTHKAAFGLIGTVVGYWLR